MKSNEQRVRVRVFGEGVSAVTDPDLWFISWYVHDHDSRAFRRPRQNNYRAAMTYAKVMAGLTARTHWVSTSPVPPPQDKADLPSESSS